VGKTKRGKGTKLVALAERSGVPIAVCAASASPQEVSLIDERLAAGCARFGIQCMELSAETKAGLCFYRRGKGAQPEGNN
jgi:hypothetical protein